MKIHITNLYGIGGTAGKAQQVVADIAKNSLHYNELGIYCYPVESDSSEMLHARIDGIISPISHGDIVIIQLPTWNDIYFDETFVDHLDAYRNLRKVFFIHDVPPLMFENGLEQLDRYINFFNRADLIILSSEKMKEFLRSKGLTVEKTVIQEMWDSPVAIDQSIVPDFKRRINFASNVSSGGIQFIRKWNFNTVDLAVTAKEEECPWAKGKNISFMGWFQDEGCLANALRKNGGFGLVWHDVPWWTEYMKLNASYKLGTYLAAGLPVIVHNSKAERELILHKNLGIAVDSIEEAVDKVEHMTEDVYNQMVHSVESFGNLIRGGYFTKKLLIDAVFKLLHD